MVYDAIIAGASFAGLAVARELDGKVLLIDRKEPGTGQTSACATPLRLAEEYGGKRSVVQKFGRFALHVGDSTSVFGVSEKWCTADYGKFCSGMLKKCGADFEKAHVKGVRGDSVVTGRGSFRSKCIVDCTGWGASLASSLKGGYVRKTEMALNIETSVPHTDDALRFYYEKGIMPHGLGWIFPAGGVSRVGFGSYRGGDAMRALERFLAKLGMQMDEVHGNFTPLHMREPVVGNVFVVGDAAGQALPLVSEGIRPALLFGKRCGTEVQRVMDGDATAAEAREAYGRAVRKNAAYRLLAGMQYGFLRSPASTFLMIRAAVSNSFSKSFLEKKYLGR